MHRQAGCEVGVGGGGGARERGAAAVYKLKRRELQGTNLLRFSITWELQVKLNLTNPF